MTYGKPITGPINLAELEERWIKEGRSAQYKSKMRYYYRHRDKILKAYRTSRPGYRDIFRLNV
jgi:hypothetical protein